jgi:hypothetical protein
MFGLRLEARDAAHTEELLASLRQEDYNSRIR